MWDLKSPVGHRCLSSVLSGLQTPCNSRIWLYVCSQDHLSHSQEAKINATTWISRGSWWNILVLLLKLLAAIGSQQAFKTACHRKPRSRKQCQSLLLKQQNQAISEREETGGEGDLKRWPSPKDIGPRMNTLHSSTAYALMDLCSCNHTVAKLKVRLQKVILFKKTQTDYTHTYSHTYKSQVLWHVSMWSQSRMQAQGSILLPRLLAMRWKKKDASYLPPPSWTLRLVSTRKFWICSLYL